MKPQLNIFKNIDKTVLFLFLALVLMGWFNIYAAEVTDDRHSIFDLNQNYGKQFVFILTSLVIATTILMLDAKVFPTFSWILYGFFMVMLVGVLFFGTEINATKAWFRFGSFAIQPSEFAKYATALALASYISQVKSRTIDFPTRIKPFIILGVPAFLVFLQKDMGTTLVFASLSLMLFREGYIGFRLLITGFLAIALFVLTLIINEFIIIGAMAAITFFTAFIIRKKKTELVQLVALFVLLSGYVYSVDYAYENLLEPHQKLRIEVLIDENADLRGAGYNLHQSKIAIGSGGFWGKGYMQGTQTKFNFVPEQATDFIFFTVGEEWGFLGSIVVIALFLWLLIRLVILSERQRSVFTRVFGYCVASLMFFHFTVNIGMTIGLVPVIGIPLPFLSYGGSSLWGFTLMIFTFLKLDSKRLEML